MQIVREDMPFKLQPTPAVGKDGKKLFFAQPAQKDSVSLRMLDDYCAQQYHMSRGELTRALEVFMQASGEFLARGYRVETPFGTYAPILKLKREITSPDDVTGDDVHLDAIEFRGNQEYLEEIKRWMAGFKYVGGFDNSLELMADVESLKKDLRECLKSHGHVTVRIFASKTKLSTYAARKQLDAWTKGDSPCLLKTKMGQQYIYTEV